MALKSNKFPTFVYIYDLEKEKCYGRFYCSKRGFVWNRFLEIYEKMNLDGSIDGCDSLIGWMKNKPKF